MKLNLIGTAYQLDNIEIDAQTCINWYAQSSENGGGQPALIPTDGLVAVHDLGNAITGMAVLSNNTLFVTTATYAYRITGGTVTGVGMIASNTHTTIADNGQQAVIAVGRKLYAVDMTTWALSEVTAEGFGGCQYVDFLDGYFVFATPDTGRFGWFGLYNTTFDALSYATAEGDPDNLVRLIVVGRELWALGEHSCEVYYNSGDKDLPFRRVGGAFLTVGCEAPQTVAKLGSALVFIAKTEAGGRQVCMTQGYQAGRISTHAIEQVLQDADVKQATAFSYQKSGHGFYVLNLPDIDRTFVFDALTSLWHERAWRDETGSLHRYRGQHHAYDGKDNLIGDWENGKVYALRRDVFTDDGQPVYRERTLPYLPSEHKHVSYQRLELEMSVNDAVADEPVIHMQWSDDYAKSWHDPMPQGLGLKDEPCKRVVWRRLGIGRQRTYRFSTTANARCALINAFVDVQGADR